MANAAPRGILVGLANSSKDIGLQTELVRLDTSILTGSIVRNRYSLEVVAMVGWMDCITELTHKIKRSDT